MARMKDRGDTLAAPSRYRSPEERKNGPFEDYEVRSALETLGRAIKIRKNHALMRAVRAEAKAQLKAAQSTNNALTGA